MCWAWGELKHIMTLEAPEAEGLDRFGAPVKFRARQEYNPCTFPTDLMSLERTLSYDDETTRLIALADGVGPGVGVYASRSAARTLAWDGLGSLVTDDYTVFGQPELDIHRSWDHDAVGNWSCRVSVATRVRTAGRKKGGAAKGRDDACRRLT
jgi:hypothetical protein